MSLNIKPLMSLNHPYVTPKPRSLKASQSSSGESKDVVHADHSLALKPELKKKKESRQK